MRQILERAKALQETMTAWRRTLHEHPETGADQPETAAFIAAALREMGLAPEMLGGGVVCVITGDRPGKTLLLRADMDALPMDEESGLPFASRVPGAAHTCGHDMHSAMLLCAAQLLSERRSELCGRVKLMFQPGEELGTGARRMLDAGLMDAPRPDAALAIHTIAGTDLPTGSIALSPGPTLASSDLFRIDVTGRGCHGSRPEMGVDPINILCHIHTMLQTVNSRELPQKEPAVLTIGELSAGSAPNIIPAAGYMTGTIRAFDASCRQLMKTRLAEIAGGTAAALGGTAKVTFLSELPAMTNEPAFTDELLGYLRALLGADKVLPMPSRMASDDFAEVMNRVPGAFMRLSMGSVSEGFRYGGHHPKVVFSEDAMPAGAAAYACCALRWLENHAGETVK